MVRAIGAWVPCQRVVTQPPDVDEIESAVRPPGSAPRWVALVVDDREDDRDAAAGWLEQAGFRVVQAATGAEALAVAESGGAELVLVDVKLPRPRRR
jgi:PleD family two-component response regulator